MCGAHVPRLGLKLGEEFVVKADSEPIAYTLSDDSGKSSVWVRLQSKIPRCPIERGRHCGDFGPLFVNYILSHPLGGGGRRDTPFEIAS